MSAGSPWSKLPVCARVALRSADCWIAVDAATYLAFGDMYRSVRLWQPARAAYEQGLQRAPDERSRAQLLFGLAALPAPEVKK